MFERIKADLAVLRSGKAGSRFQEYRKHKRHQRAGKKPVSRIITFAFGLLLLIGGLAIGWLPGPGGFIALIGLAMLTREIPFIAKAMDYCELILRKAWRRFRQLPHWAQLTSGIVGFALSALGIWSFYRYVL